MRRMLDVDIPRKRRGARLNLRWKDACKRDMTEAELKEEDATNRAEWRKKISSYSLTRHRCMRHQCHGLSLQTV